MATLICPNCKTANPPDNLFCQACGTSLKGVKLDTGDKTVIAARTKETPIPPPVLVSVPPPSIPQKTSPPPTPKVLPPPVAAGATTPPAAYRPVPVYSGTPIQKLGVYMDGIADILPGEALKVDAVIKVFIDEIQKVKSEGISVASSDLTSGTAAPRKYQLIYNGKGATVAVRFAPTGKDLFYSWDLYTRREIRWLTIAIVGGAALILAVLTGIFSGLGGGLLAGLLGFFNTFLGLLLVPGLALMLLGKILKDDIWGLYINDLDDFAADDANALAYIVDDAVVTAIDIGTAETPQKPKSKK